MALTYSKGKWVSALTLSLLCAASISGCSKKDNKNEAATDDTQVETQAQEQVVNQLPCDDVTVTNSLTRSIKGMITQQAQTEISKYATQVGSSFDMTTANGAINNIIVDFGTPKVLDDTNANGMQTCQTSLSLTVPSENIYLANEVYNGLDGKSMQQILAGANIRLSNNMLVDDAFTYVVGMQGGQSVAKVAGQPAIIKAVADIVAKSQLKEMMETNTNRNQTVRPIAPVTPRPPEEPRIPNDVTTQNRNSSTSDRTVLRSDRDSQELRNNIENVRQPITNDVEDKGVARTLNENTNAVPAVPKPSELKVPTDDSVEMVVVEEDATY